MSADGLERPSRVGAPVPIRLRGGGAQAEPAFDLDRRGADATGELGQRQSGVHELALAEAPAERRVLDVALPKLSEAPPVGLLLEQPGRRSTGGVSRSTSATCGASRSATRCSGRSKPMRVQLDGLARRL